jgi:hypothetical protein
MDKTEMLRLAAKQLRRSERGRAALANLQRLFIDGGSGLDLTNQKAASELFAAMIFNPWDWPAELTNPDNRP